jgi:RNA polymerase sigma-70 factor, ECF subfamily
MHWMSSSTVAASIGSDAPADPALVAAYRLGDQLAAAELVRRHAPALTRFLYSSGADRGELEDLVQETLFRAFRKLESWNGGASFRSWLLAIGGNLLRDGFRRRRPRLVSLEDGDVLDRSDPHADLAAGEVEDRLRQGLADLPRLQREVFLLRVQEGTEYADIAAALGTTPGAARVHYHNAVKRLKELIR